MKLKSTEPEDHENAVPSPFGFITVNVNVVVDLPLQNAVHG